MELSHALLFAADAPRSQWYFLISLAVIALVLVAPFVAGWAIANALRMKEYGWKIGLILCTLVMSCFIIGNTWNPELKRFDIKLGVDLQGGVILIYEVDQAFKVADAAKAAATGDASAATGDFDMSALIAALSRRINPVGTKEIVVRPYGANQVEIIVPEVDQKEVDQIKKTISTAGVLQFRIVANARDHQDVIDLARETANDPAKKRGRVVFDLSGNAVGLWARLARDQEIENPNRSFKMGVSGYIIRNAFTGDLLQLPTDVTNNPVDDTQDKVRERLTRFTDEQGIKELDVLMATNDLLNVNGSHLGGVMKGTDSFLRPRINFSMKGDGASLFLELTRKNLPDGGFARQLGIVLDNELLSAPNINGAIDGDGVIEGQFTDAEVAFLVNILQAGSLPVVLNKNPISSNLISPLLGVETIRQGKMAMTLATILVFIFILVYYRFAGVIACIALAMNLLLTLAIMVLIKAPLTLPGLAGLVLTVGMSVDANVLIFERMREEIARGAALRMALRNGFTRATMTIIDTNLTAVLAAVILYMIGTDQLKGFSVTLILGTLTSMFTAIFCSRVMFDLAERKRVLTQLKMFQFIGVTKLDFIAHRYLAVGASLVVIVLGLVAAIARGEQLFDIDFTGGSSVHVMLDQPAETEQVRALLDKKFGELKEPYTLTGMGLKPGQTANNMFKVDAKIPMVEDLEKLIQETFAQSGGAMKLATHTFTFGSLTESVVEAPTAPSSTAEEKKGTEPVAPTAVAPPAAQVKPAEPAAPTVQPTEPAKAPDEAAQADAAKADAPKSDAPKTDAPKTDAPKANEGAMTPLPTEMLLAFADDPKSDTAKSDTTPAAEAAKTEEKKAEAPAASPPQVAPAAPVATPPAAPAPVVPARATQVEVELNFAGANAATSHGINEPTLRAEIDAAAKELNVPLSYFQLSNPAWDGASSNAFTTWKLTAATSQAEMTKILNHLQNDFSASPIWPSSSKIGPQVASNMKQSAIMALVASWLMIIIYVWVRFQNLVFGLAAVVALIHDVLVTVAAIAFSHWLAGSLGFLLIDDFKISLTIIAALLTIIGYSINDTIVIFDRLREIRGKSPDITASMVNASVNQTLGRTLLTFATTFITVVVLYGLGGQGIHGFAFAMVIGMIAGTYSTVYIASPFVLWLAGKGFDTPKSAP